MDELELRRSVAEILDASPDQLNPDVELESFAAYDSIARLSLIVCLSDLSGYPCELAALRKLRTYGDILALVGNGSNGHGA